MPPKSVNRARVHLIAPKEINSRISDRVNETIIRGMEIEANRRPQTMQVWLEDILGEEIVTS